MCGERDVKLVSFALLVDGRKFMGDRLCRACGAVLIVGFRTAGKKKEGHYG